MSNLSLKLNRELAEAQARVKALETFEELEEIKDKWGQTRIISSEINNLINDFEVKNECDCCNGAIVYLLPYIEFECIRIYSRPYAIPFAKHYKGRYISLDDWEDELLDDFDDLLLVKVEHWLAEHESDIDDIGGW